MNKYQLSKKQVKKETEESKPKNNHIHQIIQLPNESSGVKLKHEIYDNSKMIDSPSEISMDAKLN